MSNVGKSCTSTIIITAIKSDSKLSDVMDTEKSPAMPGIFCVQYSFYRFMLISVSSISSETVMIFELPWKPRWVTIMSINP